MDEIQTQTIPSFTVLKNGSILKNIIILNKSSQNQEDEQILLVGRHPHCDITLGHPSISRYHLRIHSNPRSHSISVIDLSSVHGTWVCGMRVKPGVYVTLKEGDTVKIGGSSRVYELHWVPVNSLNEPYDVYVIKEGANQDEIDDTCSLDDDMERLEWPFEDNFQDSPFKKLDPLICSVSEYLSSSGDDTEVEHSSSSNESNEGNKNGQVFSAVLDQPESVVERTVSAVHDFNSMSELSNELERQIDGVNKEDPVSELAVNCSKSTFDDAEVEHLTPHRTGGEIVDIFASVSVQSSLVVSEGMSETEVSDSLNKSEDQLNLLRENVSNEFELQNHGIIKFELINDEIMKKKSVFEALPDGTDSDQKQTLTPVSRVKEVCMNLENGSIPTNLFDSLNENDTELFTPDKENKNPDARSGKSLLKRWKKAVSPIVNEEKDIFGFSKSLLTSVDESKNVLTRDEGEFVSTTLQQRLVDKFDPQEQNKEKNTGGDAEEARDFPTIVETIFTVPPHIWNLILSSLDPIEVANLRCSSRGLRCMLNGDEFIGRFNSIHQVGPTWNYLHVQTSEGPGSLVGFRWSDQTTLRTDLQGFFNIDEIIHTDTLTLLCSARSFFLFSRIRAGEEPILFVLNITKRSSVAINCPPPMNEFRFAWRRADIKLVVRDSENELNFEIVACVLARPRKIHICVYDSMVKDWVILQEAAECSNGVLVQENDPRSMFLVNIPFGDAYFVTMQEVGPICIQNMVFQTYFTSNISFAPELLETEDRWGIRISKHFTNQGWAATMFAHVYLKDDRRMIIRDLKLYKMTPQLEVYEQRAVLDPDHLEEAGEILVMPGAITLEATHEVVQLGMVVLVGQDLWRLKYFTFYINSGKWTVSNLPPFAAIRVGGPVLTSGLTL